MESRLVSKGKNEPLLGLVDQGRVLVRLAHRYADALLAQGFSQDATAELDLGVAKLESEEARAVERRRAPSSMGEGLEAPPDQVDGAFARDLVRRAAPRIAGYLGKMRDAAAALDERLATGQKATGALDAVERALLEAAAPNETHRDSQASALAIYATKGHVLDLMEALCDAGKRAFASEPDVASRFNLGLLEQARRRQGGGAQTT